MELCLIHIHSIYITHKILKIRYWRSDWIRITLWSNARKMGIKISLHLVFHLIFSRRVKFEDIHFLEFLKARIVLSFRFFFFFCLSNLIQHFGRLIQTKTDIVEGIIDVIEGEERSRRQGRRRREACSFYFILLFYRPGSRKVRKSISL